MNKGKMVTLILVGIIIVLVVFISLQQGSGSTNTTPGSHPQYYCCYSHPSQHEDEPPEEHPSQPEDEPPIEHPSIRP
jgi:hypothetical protein